jgi:hypothetical protein
MPNQALRVDDLNKIIAAVKHGHPVLDSIYGGRT